MAQATNERKGKFETQHSETGHPLVRISGDWLLHRGMITAEQIMETFDRDGSNGPVVVDCADLGRWDSALVATLVKLRQSCEAQGRTFETRDFPEGLRRLIDLALAVPQKAGAGPVHSPPTFVETVGLELLKALRSSGDMLKFLGETIISFGHALQGKARFRYGDVLLVLESCGPHALPIITLISFLVGMILAFVGLVQLKQFGADIFVANLVTIAMVREMGGMMTGIIMAGRTGAAFAAQLGTMNVNDEIAAYKTIGISPIEFLVLPRMVALILAVPLLTIYANVVGMLGGSVVSAMLSDVTLLQYYVQSSSAVTLGDWAGGLLKSVIYGVIIAISGCLRGMQCKKSASAVGDAATSAVVTAIVFIILAEAVLTVVYTILGV